MFHHSTNTALFLSILMSALIFSLSMAEVAAGAGRQHRLGRGALRNNTTGFNNTAIGFQALGRNTTGFNWCLNLS
jgi:hypothetical protein